MSIWSRIASGAAGLVNGGPIGALIEAAGQAVASVKASTAERRQVCFTIAAIALAAKMARVDGEASETEFEAFRQVFHLPESERTAAERFYRLARGSTAGYDGYAAQAAELLGRGSPVLQDLLEVLVRLARVDGIKPAEIEFLERVADIFGVDLRRLGLGGDGRNGEADPYAVLGLPPGAPESEVRAAYRRLVLEHHPDRHIANGMPPEFIRIAEERMAAINDAYARLTRRRAEPDPASP